MTTDIQIVKRPRGRPRVEREEPLVKRPRGRPKKEFIKKPRWIKTGRPRGRPKLDPSLKKPRKKRPPQPKKVNVKAIKKKQERLYKKNEIIQEKIERKKKVLRERKIIKKKKEEKKPRNFFSYEEAREIVYDEAISSAAMYRKWYKLNRPYRLPFNPHTTYADKWTSWNHFLRNNNKIIFDKERDKIYYRPYEEAKIYAQSLGLKVKTDWMAFCKSGKKAKDVPSRPDVIYRKEWLSWKRFLGGSTIAHIETEKYSQKYIFVAQYDYMPHDVFRIDVTNAGVQSLQYYATEHKFKIIKLYKLEDDDVTVMKQLIDRYCQKWWEGEYGDYTCSNVYELLMDLDIHYLTQPLNP